MTMKYWIVIGTILTLRECFALKVSSDVTCGPAQMSVRVSLSTGSQAWLQGLRDDRACAPRTTPRAALFSLPLNDSGLCGLNVLFNRNTGQSLYYHRVVLEVPELGSTRRELLFVRCVLPPSFNADFVRRDWLRESRPINFSAPVAPESVVPYVRLSIRATSGQELDTSSLIQPGSLLQLLFYMDRGAAAHYDISLRYLTLADATRSQEEVVVMNGCAVDPFVAEWSPGGNGEGVGGVLRAHLTAFKFRDSDTLLLLATLSVCLRACVQTECLRPDEGGGGRRRRGIPPLLPHFANEAWEARISARLRLHPHPLHEVAFEDSTNETLDTLYDTDYGGDFIESAARSELAASTQPSVTRQSSTTCAARILTALAVAQIHRTMGSINS